jgi:hypothetical protein
VIETAVWFVASQAGGPARILATHYQLDDGNCAGCITALTRWPCTAAHIAANAVRAQNSPG